MRSRRIAFSPPSLALPWCIASLEIRSRDLRRLSAAASNESSRSSACTIASWLEALVRASAPSARVACTRSWSAPFSTMLTSGGIAPASAIALASFSLVFARLASAIAAVSCADSVPEPSFLNEPGDAAADAPPPSNNPTNGSIPSLSAMAAAPIGWPAMAASAPAVERWREGRPLSIVMRGATPPPRTISRWLLSLPCATLHRPSASCLSVSNVFSIDVLAPLRRPMGDDSGETESRLANVICDEKEGRPRRLAAGLSVDPALKSAESCEMSSGMAPALATAV